MSLDAIIEHLGNFPHLQRQQLPDAGFDYALVNSATGVYCYFGFDKRNEADTHVKSLRFSLNYNRPTFFALETMPLVESLCRQFQLMVEDHQEDSVGPVSLEGLIDSWKIHNEKAVRALKATGMSLNYMPETRANEWWAYIRLKDVMTMHFGDRVFVPELLILKRPAAEPFRMFVCAEGNRQLLPPGDLVCIARSETNGGDQGLVAADRFRELVIPYTTDYRIGAGSYPLLDPHAYPEVISKTRALELAPFDSDYEQVAPDGFHNVVLE